MSKRKLAVFDVDGTIFRSSLTRRLFSQLVEDGIFLQSARRAVWPKFQAWLDRQGTYDDYLNELVQVFIKHIKGKRQADIRRAARQVVATEKSRVYRFTRDLIAELKKKNYFLVAISGSPYEIVRCYNRFLKFDRSYGWVLDVDKTGCYTGKMKYTYSFFDKKFLVEHAVKKYGLTLKGSVAVGDTESDVSMLEIVDRPIVFNPSSGLYEIAKKKKWEIVVERKDVIYHL